MTAPKSSGWYDDPDDPTKLRYWDGILWSDRTMPKLAPGLEHVGEARPESEREHTPPAGRGEPAREYQAHWGPEQFDERSRPHEDRRRDYNAPFLPGHTPNESGQWETVGQFASLPRRIMSTIVDWLMVAFIGSLVLSPFLSGTLEKLDAYNRSQMQSMQNGSTPPPITSEIMVSVFGVLGLLTLLMVLYDAVMTTTRGRTLGRMICGTHVASVNGEKVSFPKALVRAFIKWFAAIFGLLGMLLAAIVVLVAIGNDKRQGLHDKAAGTVVKRTR